VSARLEAQFFFAFSKQLIILQVVVSGNKTGAIKR
jgi:hypothetical protein